MNRVTAALGRAIAQYLNQQTGGYARFAVTPQDRLRDCLQPGDVLLVEGEIALGAPFEDFTVPTVSFKFPANAARPR